MMILTVAMPTNETVERLTYYENKATLMPPAAVHESTSAADDHLSQLNDDTNTSKLALSPPLTAPGAASSIVRDHVHATITKQVVRQKLAKLRHLVVPGAIDPDYLETIIFPAMLRLFEPQSVTYNGGIANITNWKISCYLEVMPGGVPCTNPHLAMLHLFTPLLECCNQMFLHWYRQQHAGNNPSRFGKRSCHRNVTGCRRLMTFITRYTPNPGEQALLKHVDGAGKVDGSVVVALPMEPNAPFQGGGLTFWDGKQQQQREAPDDGRQKEPREWHYDTRSGDVAFIDRAVWHQADPIIAGRRWALVIFYTIDRDDESSMPV